MFYFLYNFTHFLLYLDLFLIVRNPFYPQWKRVNYYKIMSIALIIIVLLTSQFAVEDKPMYLLVAMFIGVLNFFVSLVFLIIIIRNISIQGTSSELYKRVCTRYLTIFIIFSSQYLIIYRDYLHFKYLEKLGSKEC